MKDVGKVTMNSKKTGKRWQKCQKDMDKSSVLLSKRNLRGILGEEAKEKESKVKRGPGLAKLRASLSN